MSDRSPRLNAALEGRYRIERKIGEGGMATVYLADDLRHERKVALKVLKAELAAVVGAERFLAEIKTTANLQHPHILPLYDSGEADGFLFYVMPYVAGESLREKLEREHQLPVDEAVGIAVNVAEALDYAHRHDVIHRDIKPANILLQDGKPVVSDFGIALAVGGGGRLTETGLSLGTPHYMSPEQATGDRGVGPASDLYALGCVLYEMLVAEPPYTGGTPQAILGKIITGETTPTSKLRPSVPANVDAAARKALERVPADRFPSASAFAGALADPGFRHGSAAGAAAGRDAGPWKMATAAAALVAVILAGAWALQRPEPEVRVTRVASPFEAGQEPTNFFSGDYSVSPDGSLLVYTGPPPSGGAGESSRQLWVRRWNDEASVPIPGTVNGSLPAVSYDNELVAFTNSDPEEPEVTVVPLAGGPTRTVAPGINARWAPNGDLYFHGLYDHGVHRAPAGGGPPEVVQEASEVYPDNYVWQILPHGESALWYARTDAEEPEIGVMELATGQVTPLGFNGWTPTYLPSGHLVFETDSTLMAMPFDPDRPEAGTPVPFVEGISSFSLSSDGTLVYSTFPDVGDLRTNLLQVEREGGDSRILAELDGVGWFPRFSPDGTRLAYGLSEGYGTGGDGSDLWVLDVERGARTRVTFEGDNRWYPVWTPDGTSLTYADAATPENRILTSPADGSGRVETLFELDFRKFPTSWSPDGSTLAYYQGPQGTDTFSRDIWMLHLDGDERREEPFITTPFSENGAIFSPDGRWVLYVSDKAGQQDIYALPYPGPGAEVTISVGGGIEPAWGPDGDETFYRREGELMVVPVNGGGGTLSVGTPRRVMDDDYIRQTQGGAGGVANYAVAPDGGGFVMLEEVAREAEPGRFHVVFNWLEELRERLSVD